MSSRGVQDPRCANSRLVSVTSTSSPRRTDDVIAANLLPNSSHCDYYLVRRHPMSGHHSAARCQSGKDVDTQTNSEVIHELYNAYVTGHLAAFDVLTDDSVWVERGRNERTGVYRGKQAILEHAMQLAVLTDGTIATTSRKSARGGLCRRPGAGHGEAKRPSAGDGLLFDVHPSRRQNRRTQRAALRRCAMG